MSVLIKGMEMPKNCAECEFHQSGYPDWCDLSIRARDIHNTEIRQEWCPLVEVPTPHGRLIDADELYEKISLLFQDVNSTEDFMGIGYNHGVGDALAIIKNF